MLYPVIAALSNSFNHHCIFLLQVQVKVLLFMYVTFIEQVCMLFAHSSTSVVTDMSLIKPPMHGRSGSRQNLESPLKISGKQSKI